jgi:hypothetical protein
MVRSLHIAIFALLLAASAPAFAAEPSGCDKFAWPIAHEQQLLAAAQSADATATLDRDAGTAVRIALVPFGQAKLAMPPERKPKDASSYAGTIAFKGSAAAAAFYVTLSEGAWIDLVQDGHYLKPIAFTGATGCPNVRKSVKFEIGPSPFTLQLSSVSANAIAVVLTPAP